MSSAPRKKPAAKAVRGPGGAANAKSGRTGAGQQGPASGRARLEKFSAPLLIRLSRTPKWLLVIGLGLALFFGLIQSGGLAWLGVLLLGALTIFFGWLLAVAWPVLPVNGRFFRGLVVVALGALTVFKAMGRI